MVAKVNVSTFFPTVNLVNLKALSKVTCDDPSIMTLDFAKSEDAAAAFAAWSATKDLVFLVGQDMDCDGQSISAYQISNMAIRLSTLSMSADYIRMNKVIRDYNIKITKLDVPFKLDTNYNNGGVVDPSISIFDNSLAAVSCEDCYTQGDAQMSVQFKGTTFAINSYYISLAGNFKANMDVKLSVIKASDSENQIEVDIYTLPLHPVSVPNLFDLDTKFIVKAAIAWKADNERSISAGLDVVFPFNYNMSSDAGVIKKPSFVTTGSPKLTPHKLIMTAATYGSVNTTAALIPEFNMKFTVLETPLNVVVALSNALTVDAFSGTSGGCTGSEMKVLLSLN
jgi:hypothetical protein